METKTTGHQILSPGDLCDRCGAAGQILAILPTGDLVFCAHHGRAHETALPLLIPGQSVLSKFTTFAGELLNPSPL